MAKYFLNHPTFAIVISIFIVILGLFSLLRLPVEYYPTITPVEIVIAASLPGASAETMSQSVAAPLEQAINGVDDMLYMYSQSVSPGLLKLIVSFKVGSDPDLALINTQSRVNLAMSALPFEVQKQGIAVTKQEPSIAVFVALQSKEGLQDDVFLANYANIFVADKLTRLDGISSAKVVNARDYSMRIWLKPDMMAQFGLTISDIEKALNEQNEIHSIGLIGEEPLENPVQLTIPATALGRLKTPEEFDNIVLRATKGGAIIYLKDVARTDLGAQSYNVLANLNGQSGAFIGIYQNAGSNTIDVSNKVREKMEEISQFFPEGVTYSIPYDTSDFIKESIWHVEKTLIEAAILVAIVIFIFLHSFGATLVPLIAMIVSITGTFIAMDLFGFSLNTLSLFGLVLSIGIVVDDAIVVVESIERNVKDFGLSVKEAAFKTMEAVSKPIVAIVCVLASVFIPVSFIGGIPGQFYRQFAITIAVSVAISGFVALTLSPVLSVIFLKKPVKARKFGEKFDRFFDAMTQSYARGAHWILQGPKKAFAMCVAVLGLIALFSFAIPLGFVPKEDQGLILVSATLPDGSSLSRVQEVSKKIEEIAMKTPGVAEILSVSGYSLLESMSRLQYGTYFIALKNWNERKDKDQHAFQIINQLNKQFATIPEAQIQALNPPDIPGIGVIGGFDLWLSNDGDIDYATLNEVVDKVIAKAQKNPDFDFFISSIKANCMELFLDLELAKAKSFGVSVDQIYAALQALLGSVYINQFNKFGKVFKVVAQAEPFARDSIEDIGDIYVRSDTDKMIPLKSLVIPRFSKSPTLVQRFNGSPSAHIAVIPNITNTEKVISTMETISKEYLLPQMSYSWGGLAYQEKESKGFGGFALASAMVFMFLVLAALYEKWSLAFAIIFTIPFSILGACFSVWLSGTAANIYFQIAIITLIALSAKNAILIVEFAKHKREEGAEVHEAALAAARLRFRAIMMTSLTMIIGMLPLMITSGAGVASRQSVGIAVVGGMAAATFLAIFFVPFFYCVMENLSSRLKKRRE